MTPRFFVAALAALLPVAALAQAPPLETVTVNDPALTGLWKIAVPESIGSDFVHARFGPLRDIFCRIRQTGTAFTIECLNGGFTRSGSGTIDGKKVHIAWGSMMARMAIDGIRTENSIDGHFLFKLSGLSHEDAEITHSERLAPGAVQDGGKNTSILKAILENRPVARDDAAIARNGGATKLEALGAVEVIAYLGQFPKLGGPQVQDDFFSVYAVEFDKAERVCGLHQRDDGVLDAFLCI